MNRGHKRKMPREEKKEIIKQGNDGTLGALQLSTYLTTVTRPPTGREGKGETSEKPRNIRGGKTQGNTRSYLHL